mgnify:CR=1 FL=1|jgi:hypothetical protein
MSTQVIFHNSKSELFKSFNELLIHQSNKYLLKTRFNLGEFNLSVFALTRLYRLLCERESCYIDNEMFLEKLQILIIKNK